MFYSIFKLIKINQISSGNYKPKIVVSIQGLPDFLASKEVYDKYRI